MPESPISIQYKVGIEGAEETRKELELVQKTVTEISEITTTVTYPSVEAPGEFMETTENINKVNEELKEVVETAEEAKGKLEEIEEYDIKGFTRDVSLLLGTLSSVDYLWMSWERVVTRFNIRTFISTLLSTISFIRRLTRLIELATAKQEALNVAQAAGAVSGVGAKVGVAEVTTGGLSRLSSLLGPIGIIAAVSLATYGVVTAIQEQNARIAEEMRIDRENREMREKVYKSIFGKTDSSEEKERARRESYRSVVPG